MLQALKAIQALVQQAQRALQGRLATQAKRVLMVQPALQAQQVSALLVHKALLVLAE